MLISSKIQQDAGITVVTQGPNDKSSISTLAFKAVATKEKDLANLELLFNFHLEVIHHFILLSNEGDITKSVPK